jgi:hypothetical protein
MSTTVLQGPTPWPFAVPIVPGQKTATGRSYLPTTSLQVTVDVADVSSLLDFGFTPLPPPTPPPTPTVTIPTFANTGLPNTFTDNPGTDVLVFESPDGIAITEPAFHSSNVNTVLMNYPTPPFVMKAFFYFQQDWKFDNSGGNSYAGLVIRDDSGKLQTYGPLETGGITPNYITVYQINWSNSTTAEGSGANNVAPASPLVGIAYIDDGTTLSCMYSLSPDAVSNVGYVWYPVVSLTKATNYITVPTKIGLFLDANASVAQLVMTRFSLLHGTSTP